jgi:uncharacterized Rmd1/YagE family protein
VTLLKKRRLYNITCESAGVYRKEKLIIFSYKSVFIWFFGVISKGAAKRGSTLFKNFALEKTQLQSVKFSYYYYSKFYKLLIMNILYIFY